MLNIIKRQKLIYYQTLILLGLVNIFSSIDVSNSAPLSDSESELNLEPTNVPSTLPPSLPPALTSKKKTLDTGGNPSELAWQAWLLFDDEEISDTKFTSDSANKMRRITPKSIFIAPKLPTCPDGYESDYMNRCIKEIELDQQAHYNFILERLNARFGHLAKSTPQPESSSTSSSPSPPSSSISPAAGPIQFNIPLILENVDTDIPKSDDKKSDKPFLTFTSHTNQNNENKPIIPNNEDTIVTVYEIKNSEKDENNEEKDERIFIIGSENTKIENNNENGSIINEELGPIVEFIQETNSSITEIVDYNIPVITISRIQNRSELTDINHDSNNDKHTGTREIFDDDKISNDSITLPLTIILSPSNSSTLNINDSSAPVRNVNTEQVIVKIKNNMNESTVPENIAVNLPSESVTSVVPIEGLSSDSESTVGPFDVEITTTPVDERDLIDEEDETTDYPTEDAEDHGDYTDHTEDLFTSTESDEEILTHSEAGLSVTMPALYSTALHISSEEKNITANNISSVVVINDDLIQETTLLDLNVSEPIIISKDSMIEDNSSLVSSTNEEKEEEEKEVIIVTPQPEIVTRKILASRDIVSIIYSNNNENTESSKITEEITTEHSEDILPTETVYPTMATTQIDETLLADSDNINPVVTIEEASSIDELDRLTSQTIIMKPLKLILPNDTKENHSQSNIGESNSSQVITVPSTNTAKIISSHNSHDISSSTSVIDETPSTKHIYETIPVRFENKRKNSSPSSILINNNDKIYNYGANSQHFPLHQAYGIINNNPVIRTINQYSEINQNVNNKNFFSNDNFGNSYKPTRNYVRFPTDKRPHSESGLVRFPSNDANSIHIPNDVKDKYNHRPYILQNNQQRLTEAGTPTLKQSNRHAPPCCRSDHQQYLSQLSRPTTNEQRPRDSSPMLKLWTNVPLFKDPNLLYHPTYATVIPIDTVKQRNDGQSHSLATRYINNKKSIVDQTQKFSN